MNLLSKYFEELSLTELYKLLQARAEIFVVEQNCVYQDLDDIDLRSLHVFYESEGKILAYLRAFEKEDGVVQMGRVLTVSHGTGLGGMLLKAGIREIQEKLNPKRIYIEAQCYATGYYEREGFQICSDPFLEDGIPHVQMILELGAPSHQKGDFMFIRKAARDDLSRIAEIFVFNNRINYLPIFRDEAYSFGKLQVVSLIDTCFEKPESLAGTYVYDDGLIRGFLQIEGTEIQKLYVDPFFQSHGIGRALIEYAVEVHHADCLWVLEKNTRAVSFYRRHGFVPTGERVLEEGTAEHLLRLRRSRPESPALLT